MSVFDEKAARLARLFTAICLGEFDVVRELRRSAPDGEPDRAWREAVLQTHLFCGFPRLVQAYGVLDEEGGLGEPEPGEPTAASSTWRPLPSHVVDVPGHGLSARTRLSSTCAGCAQSMGPSPFEKRFAIVAPSSGCGMGACSPVT